MKNPFRELNRFEKALYGFSLVAVTVCCILSGSGGLFNLAASLIGVTALIFVAKGMVIGQVLTVVFACFYGVISLGMGYYGEMITYLGMSAPIAALAVVSWIRHPYKDSAEVQVSKLTKGTALLMWALTAVVTAAFWFILKALGNSSLFFSTVSVATSFIASYLTLFRSPFYGLGYAANDVVLIILWCIASTKKISYLPMVACFAVFLINDTYGFFNWQRMKKRQKCK